MDHPESRAGSTAPRSYLLAFGEAEGTHLHSFVFTRGRLFTLILLFLAGSALLIYLAVHFFYRTEVHFKTQSLRKENALIQERFSSWENRVEKLEDLLSDLEKKNRQIRITASLTLPEIEYGTGGSASFRETVYRHIPRLEDIEQDVSLLESQMDFLRKSTDELESVVQSKIREIAHYPSIRPIKGGWISSVFGTRVDPFTGQMEEHPGLDISVKPETEVRATGAGVVKSVNTFVVRNKGYGKFIIIDHGFGYETLYGHLSQIFVQKGQQVKRWDLIGLTGNTGKSTAPHLHYGVLVAGKYQDPENFILD
ncbi:peptidoglycan DD-metalloendopeptidase family protein [bacterium]|nr:peptidoglycan DD-metalloendopeptidase family protein [bacterium]